MNTLITADVIRQNETEFATVAVKQINATNADLGGLFWRTPISSASGQFVRFDYYGATQAGTEKPSDDSVKTLRVRDNVANQYYWVVIGDDDGEEVWTDAVNSDTADDADITGLGTVPDIISEEKGCLNTTTGEYTYQWVGAPLGAGQSYTVDGSVNGTALPDLGSDFASIAAFVTAAISSWSSAGTWTNPSGNIVKLVSSTAVTAGLSITVGTS